MSVSRRHLLAATALFLAVVALYIPTLRGGFVYDSIAQVLYSDYIHTPSHWADVLTLRVVGQDELDRNRPLHLASLMLDAAIWGKNPFGYRLTSVLLHALNASMLFVFIAVAFARRNSNSHQIPKGFGPHEDSLSVGPAGPAGRCLSLHGVWAAGPAAPTEGGKKSDNFSCLLSSMPITLCAAFGTLVFAFHPLVVEAVAEPSNREDLLVLLPMLTGLLCIALPVRSKFAVNAALVLCSFFAVLAKESGVAVPFVFAVAYWLSRRGHVRNCAPGLIGGFATAVGFLVASYVWRPGESAVFASSPHALADNSWTIIEVQLRIWTLQFWQIVWPWNLSAHYTADAIAGITLPAAIAAIAAILIAAIFAWRTDRLAALGVAVYALCLLPASNFAAQYHPIADRYLYVPLAGIGMITSARSKRMRINYPSGFAGGLLAVLLSVLLCLEYLANLKRQRIWQQPATLWSDVLRQYPGLSQALLGMANVHFRAGDYEAARIAATEAVMASNGRWADAWALRAICEWETGNRATAPACFRQAQCLSRVYSGMPSMAATLIFSPEQLQVLAKLSAEAR